MLDKRPLGKTGLMISPLGLGTVKFGRNEGVKYPKAFDIPEEGDLAAMLSLASDLGINMLDTAPAYGTAEERLGRLLKGRRQDWVIIGKAGEEFENGESHHDFSPAHFTKSLERSLKRLNTDHLDVLLIHSDGRDMEVLGDDDLIETLQSFKSSGKVRAIGASTKTVEGGLRALELLDVAMATYSPSYTEEEPVLDAAAKSGKGLLLKKVLNSGHSSDLQKALGFALHHPGVSGAVIGTINPKHLRQNVKAAQRALAALPAA